MPGWAHRPNPSSRTSPTGTFGTWHETATNIHLALLAGALEGLGYGQSLGRFILEDGTTLPEAGELAAADRRRAAPIRSRPRAPTCCGRCRPALAGRADQRPAPLEARLDPRPGVRHGVPMTVHPGIGYDIISNHPVFSGAAIGRAAEMGLQALRRLAREPRWRRGALDRLGHHGPAGLREGVELRQQPAAPGRARSRPRPHASTSSTSRMAAAGIGPRASPPRPTRPITCGSARAFPAWAARFTTCNATI